MPLVDVPDFEPANLATVNLAQREIKIRRSFTVAGLRRGLVSAVRLQDGKVASKCLWLYGHIVVAEQQQQHGDRPIADWLFKSLPRIAADSCACQPALFVRAHRIFLARHRDVSFSLVLALVLDMCRMGTNRRAAWALQTFAETDDWTLATEARAVGLVKRIRSAGDLTRFLDRMDRHVRLDVLCPRCSDYLGRMVSYARDCLLADDKVAASELARVFCAGLLLDLSDIDRCHDLLAPLGREPDALPLRQTTRSMRDMISNKDLSRDLPTEADGLVLSANPVVFSRDEIAWFVRYAEANGHKAAPTRPLEESLGATTVVNMVRRTRPPLNNVVAPQNMPALALPPATTSATLPTLASLVSLPAAATDNGPMPPLPDLSTLAQLPPPMPPMLPPILPPLIELPTLPDLPPLPARSSAAPASAPAPAPVSFDVNSTIMAIVDQDYLIFSTTHAQLSWWVIITGPDTGAAARDAVFMLQCHQSMSSVMGGGKANCMARKAMIDRPLMDSVLRGRPDVHGWRPKLQNKVCVAVMVPLEHPDSFSLDVFVRSRNLDDAVVNMDVVLIMLLARWAMRVDSRAGDFIIEPVGEGMFYINSTFYRRRDDTPETFLAYIDHFGSPAVWMALHTRLSSDPDRWRSTLDSILTIIPETQPMDRDLLKMPS